MSSLIKNFCFIILCLLFLIKCTSAPNNKELESVQTPDLSNAVAKKDTTVKIAAPNTSDITCPSCGFTKNERLPTEVCLIKYTCQKCSKDIFPKEGDCCVFCSYGTVKCPSKQ